MSAAFLSRDRFAEVGRVVPKEYRRDLRPRPKML